MVICYHSLTKKTVIYDFRQNDIKNSGQGAPLAPVFHKLIVKLAIETGVVKALNVGGIAANGQPPKNKIKIVL